MKPPTHLGMEKWIDALLCILGVGAIAYGMVAENDPLFVVGIILVVAGYLLIRRRLKAGRKDERER